VIIATGKDKYEAVQHLLKATQYDKEWPVTALFDHPDTLLFTEGLK
jgi:6-phosphogluconolactonase/glucosamine-6-phosphate isomerase/deaminase